MLIFRYYSVIKEHYVSLEMTQRNLQFFWMWYRSFFLNKLAKYSEIRNLSDFRNNHL